MNMYDKIKIPQDILKKILKHEAGHYITLIACDIMPSRVEFTNIEFETDDEIIHGLRGCTINPCNKYLNTIEEVSKYTYVLALNSLAGAFAGQLDESSKKINKELAINDFINFESAKSDFLPFKEDLKIYIACNQKNFEQYNRTDKDIFNIVQEMMVEDIIKIIEDNADEIIELKNYFFKRLNECNENKIVIETSEIKTAIPSIFLDIKIFI